MSSQQSPSDDLQQRIGALSDGQIAAIFAALSDGLVVLGAEWRISHANAQARVLLGTAHDDLVGSVLWEAVPAALGSDLRDWYAAALTSGNTHEREVQFGEQWLRLRASAGGEGLVLLLTDITHERAFAARLEASEARFRSLAEAIPQLVWIARPDGYHEFFNQRWYDYTGTTIHETGGEGWATLLHPEDSARTHQAWQRSLATGEPYSIEYRFRNGVTGEYRWFLGRALPLRGPDGAIERWFGTCTDIHEQKELEAALRSSEERFSRLFAARIIGLMIADLSGAIREANSRFLEIVGYSRAELEAGALTWPGLTPPGYEATDAAAYAELVATGSVAPYEKAYRHRDGHEVPVLVGATMIDDSSEQCLAYVLDMTARRQAEAERDALLEREQAANQAAQEALRVRDAFFSIVAHELKSPLTTILGQAQLMVRRFGRRDDNDQRDVTAVERIIVQTQRMNQLIEAMLDSSRLEMGQLALEPALIDLREVVRLVAEDVQPTLDGHQLSVALSEEPLTILGDSERLSQAVRNLVNNAIKYSPEGGEVWLRTERHAEGAAVIVADQGIGIAKSAQDHIFDQFFRANSTAAPTVKGLGIGLFIVRQLVQMHGGRIVVESEEGRGSVFTIILPLA